MATTANFAWEKPTVGGDSGSWGTKLNTTLDDIDTDLDTANDAAQAALPKAGGTMTGAHVNFRETSTVTNLGTTLSGATAVDCALSNVFKWTLSAAITISFSNAPSNFGWLIIELKNATTTNTVTWPAAVKWPGGTTPSFTATTNHYNTFFLYTLDGGTTWRGANGIADTA